MGKTERGILGCKEIAELKVIFVKLPWRLNCHWEKHAVVKRCKNYTCAKANKSRTEAKLLREHPEQYGECATRYFGDCDAPKLPMDDEDGTLDRIAFDKYVIKNLPNFSVGYTAVVELGKPSMLRRH